MLPNTKPNGGHGKEAVVPDKDAQCANKDDRGQVNWKYGGDNQEVDRTPFLHKDMQDSAEHGLLLRYVSSYAANQSKTLIRFCGCLSLRCQCVEIG